MWYLFYTRGMYLIHGPSTGYARVNKMGADPYMTPAGSHTCMNNPHIIRVVLSQLAHQDSDQSRPFLLMFWSACASCQKHCIMLHVNTATTHWSKYMTHKWTTVRAKLTAAPSCFNYWCQCVSTSHTKRASLEWKNASMSAAFCKCL